MIEGKKLTSTGKLSYGMVGGGPGSFIGDVHRKAAKFDGKNELVAGCFSRYYNGTLATGRELSIDQERLYESYKEMAEKEAARGKGGIDFISIVTPNSTHYPIAKAFLQNGINVVCDKPLTVEVEEAEELARLVEKNSLLFCVTYTYSGYPVVKHARKMIEEGEIGEIRMVMAEYPQEWLAEPDESGENKQAAWRIDPRLSGKSNCVGDIGSHIENTVSYMTGLEIESLCAKLDIFVKGRVLDDNASIMVKYDNGASGLYWSSQIAIGHDNSLKIRVYGAKGSIEWVQEEPNQLKVSYLDKPTQILSRGRDKFYPLGEDLVRLPAGHPEGFFEAFANIYSNFTDALLMKKTGIPISGKEWDFPTVKDGIQGVKFISLAVESSKQGAVWLDFK